MLFIPPKNIAVCSAPQKTAVFAQTSAVSISFQLTAVSSLREQLFSIFPQTTIFIYFFADHGCMSFSFGYTCFIVSPLSTTLFISPQTLEELPVCNGILVKIDENFLRTYALLVG